MGVRNLEYLFQPKSVAVVGASNRPHSVGRMVMHNLLHARFEGPILPVNPKHPAVASVLCYPNVASLPLVPDLAIVCTPPQTIPEIVAELGDRGTKAAVILTAGLSQATKSGGPSLLKATLDTAKRSGLRLLGPNCLGLLVPGMGLNASFAHTDAIVGQVAFVSQSGALCTAVLDWAKPRNIGFSHFISIGDGADVDFADVLDYLGSDPNTRAILLYIEGIRDARRFMSAARGAARNKPVLAIKSGQVEEGSRAAASHSGALAGEDSVYDAAIRRAGMLRVFEIDELFEAVETLARLRQPKGDRLAIVGNGGGPGVMATDALVAGGGRLAQLSEETVRKLDALLPSTWSRSNPVDIVGDADSSRFAKALEIVLQNPETDAVLAMHVPTAIAPSDETARAVIEVVRGKSANVLTSWLGGESANLGRSQFAESNISTYDTPDDAVRAFLHLVRFQRNQDLLMETPPSTSTELEPVTASAQIVIQQALAEGRQMLSEPEAKAILAAYGIPIVETKIASGTEDAIRAAREIGFPVAVKIVSPDVSHKSDVGGVALDLASPAELESAIQSIQGRIDQLCPDAEFKGFAVQKMACRSGAHELIVGATTDPVFGPILLFGQGGTAVEAIGDRAVGLPPLNVTLARELMSRTRVSRLLHGYRDRPAADNKAIELTLIQISQLIIDIPEIVELDINPLLADDNGVLALDARIAIAPATQAGTDRLAIRPYPVELEESIQLRSGRKLLLRPIRPEDEPAHYGLFGHLSPEDIRFRFFGLVKKFPHSEMARFTQIDYDREMAFIALGEDEAENYTTLGVVRAIADFENERAEFAIVVRSDMKGLGLGHALLEKMIRYCRDRGYKDMVGEVLANNKAMLNLARSCGFTIHLSPEPDILEVLLQL